MLLQVLLVEDEPVDLKAFQQGLPTVFQQNGLDVTIHPCGDFDSAFNLASDPLSRYDLIVSDTYRGPTKNGDADVMKMVDAYRGSRFCPLVIYSSGVKPPALTESPFVIWADKSKGAADIERAITEVLKTGVPQIARKLHEDLESSAASFLWPFLEEHWPEISKAAQSDPQLVERLIRRRAAIQIGDLDRAGDTFVPILQQGGSEYYIYPRLRREYYSLGDVLRNRRHPADLRVVLTPHCYLFIRPGQNRPGADFVLTVKTVPVAEVLGEKIPKTKALTEKQARHKKLALWTRSPAQTETKPEGRHWYLPGFLDIPHLFCDLLQVESVPYDQVAKDFDAIATLVGPYAEALQASFVGFYASVGIPDLILESVENLLDE